MAFSHSRTASCVAIICSQLFLISVITAGTVVHGTSPDLQEKTSQNELFEGRAFLPESGRSLLLTSMLLLPLGIGLIILAIMAFIPIPIVVTPTGRAYQATNRAIDLAKKVMTSEECVERISCELSNFAKSYEATSWIPRKVESYFKNSSWVEKISRGLHETNHCKQFICHPFKSLKKFE